MQWRSAWIGWLCLAVGFGATAKPARAEDPASARTPKAPLLSVDDLPAKVREPVAAVLEHPTLHTVGPAESFSCDPATYYEFLEHPDRAVTAWRKLGAKCLTITDRGKGRFGWVDEHGSDVHWDLIQSTPRLRVWYAEGQVRPNAWLPTVAFQAVVVLHLNEGRDADGRPMIRHQAELVVHSDSKTAALAARLLGPSAPRIAEQYVAQIQMFYSALAWYFYQHPEDAAEAMRKTK
jgi:hypothetical protein